MNVEVKQLERLSKALRGLKTLLRPKYYSGIGSRDTPAFVMDLQTQIAQLLSKKGWWLRSGGAQGSDSAFELGAGEQKVIYTKDRVEKSWLKLAANYHPAWNRCSDTAKLLHGRNSPIILGEDLGDPSEFVLCWTKDGKASGGTGQGIRIALDSYVPVFNLFLREDVDKFCDYLEGM